MELLTPNIPAHLFIILISLVPIIMMILALIDIIRRKDRSNSRGLWALVVVAVPLIGAVLYFAMGRERHV